MLYQIALKCEKGRVEDTQQGLVGATPSLVTQGGGVGRQEKEWQPKRQKKKQRSKIN